MSDQGVGKSILNTAVSVIRNPFEFYRQMPREGGFREPVLFLAVMIFIGLFINLIRTASANLVGSIVLLVAGTPILVLLSFLGALFLHIVWKVLGSQESYETAYRCMAYTYAVLPIASVLLIFPVAGAVIDTLWIGFLIIVASINVHRIKPSIAWVVWGVITILFVGVNLTLDMGMRKAGTAISKEGAEIEKIQKELMEQQQKAIEKMKEKVE